MAKDMTPSENALEDFSIIHSNVNWNAKLANLKKVTELTLLWKQFKS